MRPCRCGQVLRSVCSASRLHRQQERVRSLRRVARGRHIHEWALPLADLLLCGEPDVDLWGLVLDLEDQRCSSVTDQVLSTALPAANTADEVFAMVHAFIGAGIPSVLSMWLEQFVLH